MKASERRRERKSDIKMHCRASVRERERERDGEGQKLICVGATFEPGPAISEKLN